jgi:hypothetical protein
LQLQPVQVLAVLAAEVQQVPVVEQVLLVQPEQLSVLQLHFQH